MLSQRRALVCVCLCTYHFWVLYVLSSFVSVLSDPKDTHSHTCAHTHSDTCTHRVKHAHQAFPALRLSYHVQHSGESTCLPPIMQFSQGIGLLSHCEWLQKREHFHFNYPLNSRVLLVFPHLVPFHCTK